VTEAGRPSAGQPHRAPPVLAERPAVSANLRPNEYRRGAAPGPDPTRPLRPCDPRPDLAADTQAWRALLEVTFLLDGEEPDGLYGALHGVRCCGARLVPAGVGGPERTGRGYRLCPGTAYLGGAAAWAADRERWLAPHADVLAPLLRGLPTGGPADAPAAVADQVEAKEH
jgi:hypothetical protein